ncbi:mitochondrial carrier [Acaromyces ingoldii]|uniref:Mitochondrial carrier n=1 Tax=Acaromyces ingoldii TaxID=215250 RepID=A0A316YUT5_9BASI|nr:mitochondrial carrier [Acaromyces ingoldii]PWN93177.1 mitochondrial carrier [Acaromyces ingoldii]
MLHASALAGACAGLVSSIVTCPLDVVKTKLQAQSGPTRPLRQGWSGPAGHPNGSIGGGGARLAYEAQRRSQAIKEAITGEGAESRYEGLFGTLRKIWREDGFRGFYRGLGPTIFGYLPTWAIYFTVYDQCKTVLAERFNPTGEEDFMNHIVSAMTAGAASTCCTSPLWVVKTRFMLQSGKNPATRPYRHTGDAFVQIFRTEGWRGFYRGLLPSLFGVSHVAVQFPLYEQFKSSLRRRLDTDELTPSMILTCSSSAKMIASVLTYPHEVLRTRLQMQPRAAVADTPTTSPTPSMAQAASEAERSGAQRRGMHTAAVRGMSSSSSSSSSREQSRRGPPKLKRAKVARRTISHMANMGVGGRYTGVLQACATIAREEGVRGFYKGMGVNLIRTVPSSALTILTYEIMMQHLNYDPDQDSQDDDGDVQTDSK